MEKALAEVSETAGALNTSFDLSSDIGAIMSRVDDQINKAKARSKVASDLSDQGIDDLKAKQAADKAAAGELLAQFKIEQGLAEPSSEPSEKTVGPQKEARPSPVNNPLGRSAPEWARELAASYVSGSASVFLLHGNVHDLVPIPDTDTDEDEFVSLEHYLATQLFGQRDIVLSYDRGSGIRFLAPGDSVRRQAMQEDFHKTLTAIDLISGTGYANARPKEPKLVFELLDRYILHKLVDTPKDGNRKSLAIIIRYIETITPRGRCFDAERRARSDPHQSPQLGKRSRHPRGGRHTLPRHRGTR